MKKTTLLVSILIAVAIMIMDAYGVFKTDKPVNKEINLAISSNNNYSSAAYDEAKASVHVTITKVSGTKQTIVLDKVYNSMQLKTIPTNGNAIVNNVTIPNVFTDKEKLFISYTILYDSWGSIIQLSNGTVASKKLNAETIAIHV